VANTIRIKRSTGSSAPTSLENAELAFSEGNEILYFGKGTGGAGGSATSIIPVGGKGKYFDKETTQTANFILAGPTSGSAAAAAYRALVAADIPSIAHTKISDFDTGVRVNRLDQMAAPTAAVSANSQKITNLADCTADNDAANKGYVDGVAQGLDIKDSCVVVSTSNLTLSGTQSVDGVSLSADDRVLVAGQSTASQNGIYKVVSGGSWTRADDLATGVDAAGVFTFIEKGTTNAENGFVCTSDKGSAVVGTNNLTFAQFSGAGQITAGDGLQKSGNSMSADLKSNGGVVIESGELAVKLDASSITGTLAIGDGGTGATSASAARTALGLAIGTNVVAFAADLNTLSSCQSGGASALAALTSTEIAILDGATVTTTELNTCCDGNTSATSTTLAAADRLVVNDAGTMVQVALSDLVTFLENGSVSGFDIDGGTY